MQAFQPKLPSERQGLPQDQWLDECIQSALYGGSTPTHVQRKQARANVMRLARQQVQLPVFEERASKTTASLHILTLTIGFVRRQVFGLLRSCFVNDAPYNRANGTSVWARRRTSSELAYLEFAPMSH